MWLPFFMAFVTPSNVEIPYIGNGFYAENINSYRINVLFTDKHLGPIVSVSNVSNADFRK